MMTRRQVAETFYGNSLAAEAKVTKEDVSKCLDLWEQPHRYYHGFNHLVRLLEEIQLLPEIVWSAEKKEKMELLALFHDVVYNPLRNDNEEKSIEFVKGLDVVEERLNEIFDAIRWTQYKKDQDFMKLDCDNYVRLFCQMDIGSTCMDCEGDNVGDVVHREIQLCKEYQFWDFPVYRQKRLAFLDRFKYFSTAFTDQATDFLSNYRPKIGVYAGSFNPFHIGHMNIVEQAEKIFDKVIIAVGNNPLKGVVPFANQSVEQVLPFHQVTHYNTLLSDYLKTLDYADVTLIRGLRSGYDLDYEMNQLRVLEDYECKLPVAYFLCSKETVHVSSSMIRGLAKFYNGNAEKYLPTKYKYANSF